MKRRWPSALLAAIVVLAPIALAESALGATSCPDGAPCVRVTITGTSESSAVVTPTDVADSDVDATYQVRSVAGGSVTDTQITGLSIRKLITDDLGLTIDSVTFVEITIRDGRIMTLSPAELGDPAGSDYPFPHQLMPAVFSVGSEFLGYIRPLHDDDQPGDFDQTESGGAIAMTVHTTGSLIEPVVTTDRSTISSGESVAFSAGFAQQPSTALTYSWNFGDGSSQADAASVTHVYSAPGTYDTVVTVRGADGSLGVSKAARVVVGAAPTPTETPGPGAGAATAAPTPVATSTKPGGTSTAKPSPRPTATKTGKPSAAPTSTPRPTRTATPSPTPTATSTVTPTPAPTPTTPDDLETVSGILITGSDPVPTDDAPATPTTSPSTESTSAASVGWGSAAGATSVVLLGAGVLLETGTISSWLARRKRRGI